MQQRVGIARALATYPSVLLMDEPFGALDAVTRSELQRLVRRIQQDLQQTLLLVTHDIVEAFLLGDRIGIFNAGTLEQVGTPSRLLRAPATQFVRDLLARPLKQLQAFRELQ
jgi:osmoprotectant transport system ATP-binding protein